MHPRRLTILRSLRAAIAVALTTAAIAPASAQQQGSRPQGQRPQRPRQVVKIDSARAEELYVSNRPEDHPPADFERQIAQKKATDSILAARAPGAYEFKKITYKSNADGMEIPAYLFAPLNKRGPKGHAAMVWVDRKSVV